MNQRVPVQGCGMWWLSQTDSRRTPTTKPHGTIEYQEHLEVYKAYSQKYGTYQSAERIAQRGGFAYDEAIELLGHDLTTWQPLLPNKK